MHGLQSIAICEINVQVSIIETVRPEQKNRHLAEFWISNFEITFLETQLIIFWLKFH